MAFDEKKFVGTDALSELSTKVKTELDKKTDKAGALTNVSYDTTNKKFTKTTQGAHDPVTTDIVTTATLKNDMGIADFDGTFNSLKSKPTTISGYGITDAKVQNSTVTIGSNSVTALTQEDVSSTYDSSGTYPVDGKAIAAALGTLDVESVGGAGKYISAISETDGKISATAETMDSTPTSSSTKAVTSDGIYEYVNSSVATNTAYFIGTFDSVEELEAYSGIITNNDYAFVTSTDSSGNTLYNRYKYNGSTHTWAFEYALNNSSFTSAQWATIQSGLTSSDKTKLDGIQSGANKTIVDAAMSPSSTNPVQNKVVNTALAGKQDTLTFDSAPTQSSTNPVTSAGIYTDQARQDALEAQDRAALIEVENKGAKNIAEVTAVSSTAGGVDYTVNPDGTVIANRVSSSSSSTWFRLNESLSLKAGTYVLSGGKNSGERVLLSPTTSLSDAIADSQGSGAEFTLTEDTDNLIYAIRVAYTDSPSNVKFYPMICSKAEWDISHQFEPYALPNPILTPALIEQVDSGSKNVFALNPNVVQGGLNGLTPTFNADGTVRITGTLEDNTQNGIVYLYRNFNAGAVSGFVLSGGIDASMSLRIQNGSSPYNTIAKSDGDSTIIPSNSVTNALVYLWVNKTVTSAIDITIKPMICTKTAWDVSHKYEPYAPTNRELYEDKASVDEVYGTSTTIAPASGETYDLNDLPIGRFQVPTSTYATRITNSPTTGSGYDIECRYNGSSNYKTQIAWPNRAGSVSYDIWVRHYGTTWSDWLTVLTTEDIDSTPTAESTNPVSSGGVQAPLAEVVDNGAKNLLKNELGSGTKSGIAYTTGTDGSIVITGGTATGGNADFVIPFTPKESGQYVLQGCPSGGSGVTYKGQIALYPSMTNVAEIFDNTSVTTTLTGGTQYAYRFRVYSGKAIGDSTIYPMVCSKAAWDVSHKYVPFARTNSELTTEADYAVNTGVKNLLHFDAIGSGVSVYGKTYTHNGITYTLNEDMTVTATGTADRDYNSYAYLILDGSFAPIDDYCDGKHIVSGCPADGSTSKYRMYITRSGWGSLNETGSGAIIPDKGIYTGLLIACFVSKGYEIPDGKPLVFKPMIRSAAITDSTFVPYAITNPVLTPALIEQVDNGSKNIVDLSKTTFTTNEKDGVTVTRSGDTFSVTGTGGTSTNNFFNLYYNPSTVLIPTGTWVFALFGTGLDNIRIEVSDNVSPDVQKGAYGENPFVCTVPAGITQSYFRICTKAGATFTNTSFKIMICSKAAWDVSHSYQPYGPTNAELQETKQDKLSTVDRDLIRSLVYGNGFDLAPTSENQVDLNDLMTPGKYRIQSAGETDYVTNKPERRAAGIVVEVASSTGYIRQTWLPSLSANEADFFCIRHYRSSGSGAANGWSAWYKYEGTVMT